MLSAEALGSMFLKTCFMLLRVALLKIIICRVLQFWEYGSQLIGRVLLQITSIAPGVGAKRAEGHVNKRN